jgi:ribosomal protein S6
MLDKNKLLNSMKQRRDALQNRIERDFGGGFSGSDILVVRELTYWIKKIERGEFNVKVWE